MVERQESWTIFVVGSLPKFVTTSDTVEDPIDGLLLQESSLALIQDDLLVIHIAWTDRSKDPSDNTRHERIHVPEYKAHKLPRGSNYLVLQSVFTRSRIANHFPHTENATDLSQPEIALVNLCAN